MNTVTDQERYLIKDKNEHENCIEQLQILSNQNDISYNLELQSTTDMTFGNNSTSLYDNFNL
jgi:hypothetical protein